MEGEVTPSFDLHTNSKKRYEATVLASGTNCDAAYQYVKVDSLVVNHLDTRETFVFEKDNSSQSESGKWKRWWRGLVGCATKTTGVGGATIGIIMCMVTIIIERK